MRRFYNAIIGTCSVLFLWGSVEAAGAEQSVKTRIDSTVVELDNGDVVVKYSVKPFDFGTLHHPDPAQRRSLVFSEEEKNQHFDTFRASQEAIVCVEKVPEASLGSGGIFLIMMSERFRWRLVSRQQERELTRFLL